jgi:hypothetical protein
VIVLDTSAMVELLVGSDATAEEVRALVKGQKLAALHAIDLECASSLRGLVNGRKHRPPTMTVGDAAVSELRLGRATEILQQRVQHEFQPSRLGAVRVSPGKPRQNTSDDNSSMPSRRASGQITALRPIRRPYSPPARRQCVPRHKACKR